MISTSPASLNEVRNMVLTRCITNREEEEPDDYRFPLTLKSPKVNNTNEEREGIGFSNSTASKPLISVATAPTVAAPVAEHVKVNGL